MVVGLRRSTGSNRETIENVDLAGAPRARKMVNEVGRDTVGRPCRPGAIGRVVPACEKFWQTDDERVDPACFAGSGLDDRLDGLLQGCVVRVAGLRVADDRRRKTNQCAAALIEKRQKRRQWNVTQPQIPFEVIAQRFCLTGTDWKCCRR